jgi:choline dehydrogenase
MPIRREPLPSLTPLHAAFMQASLDHGFAHTDDHNDPRAGGVGVIPKNVVDGVRVSAAAAYLDPATRQRPNLDVIANILVHRLLWGSSGRCAGVVAEVNGQVRELAADAVVLCAGVIGTPAVLMRSGVGDPAALRALGVPVALPLPGVGENLMEHPVVGLWGTTVDGLGGRDEPLRQTLLRCASPQAGVDDLHLCLMTGLDGRQLFPHAGVPTLSGLTVCFNRSVSRGRVRVTSADPHAPVQVSNNCLGEAGDVAPLAHGVRLAWELMQSLGLRGKFTRLLVWTGALVGSPKALEQAVRTFVRPAAHGCGTARMGRSPDEGAVVDAQGRLFGAANVWVADASVFPRIPGAPPHLTCLMVAEKIADGLRCLLSRDKTSVESYPNGPGQHRVNHVGAPCAAWTH